MVKLAFSGKTIRCSGHSSLTIQNCILLPRTNGFQFIQYYHQQSINDLFSLPLSTEAFSQLQAVESIREHFPLMDQHDIWNSNWGPSPLQEHTNFWLVTAKSTKLSTGSRNAFANQSRKSSSGCF